MLFKVWAAFLFYKIFVHKFFGHVHMRTKIFRSCAHAHTGGEHKKSPVPTYFYAS